MGEMAIFDRIVVGVDGSEFGLEALRQALVLAPAESAVHAVTAQDMTTAVHAGFLMADAEEQLGLQAAEARDEAAALLAHRSGSDTRLVRGAAKDVLRGASDACDATLLALGGRASSRLVGIMVGETAATLLHDGDRSVLFARPSETGKWEPRRIVVGLDGSDHALAALAVADELAGRLAADVHVVAATGGKSVEREGPWVDRVDAWDDGQPVTALVDRSEQADLLIVGSRGVHGVRALGSVSERVAHSAHCSALVVHAA